MGVDTLRNLQPKEASGEGGLSADELTERAAGDILGVLPAQLDLKHIAKTYPVSYRESLNAVLIQESIRYNKLLGVISASLKDLLKALKGLVVMSEALENMSSSLARNAVPLMWSSKAYPSLKPLAAWVKDLRLRVSFMQSWAENGIPVVFWISGFYFPQGFLTGALQNFARKHGMAIDTIAYAFDFLTQPPPKKPDDGCCVRGLYMEGARWNVADMSLEESRAKELHTGTQDKMCIVQMKPEQYHRTPSGAYECPVYKTLARAGTLSTTGHSTNYVMTLELPTRKPPAHWAKRGCALFCALDY
ncbi:Dynein heavy chain 1, axonemal [Eumeta japonica]|uniref:Dynein heavy chain 1, axonemal n=1 Tax=Eumeta variegata TaxID=151549 RepID=A0A4C1STC7_EUMVA|nr:Dynein heavy chain 1, axonemal [Eumeta japonica]